VCKSPCPLAPSSLSLMHRQVAIALLDIDTQDKGSPKSSLVLAPLPEGLLCATFPATDLPKAELQQPQAYRKDSFPVLANP
jgi:hypothetical protein